MVKGRATKTFELLDQLEVQGGLISRYAIANSAIQPGKDGLDESKSNTKKSNVVSPWQLCNIACLTKKTGKSQAATTSLYSFDVAFDQKQFIYNLGKILKRSFGKSVVYDVTVTAPNAMSLSLELDLFAGSTTKHRALFKGYDGQNRTVLGLSLWLNIQNKHVTLGLCDHFVVGCIRSDTLKKIYTAIMYALGFTKSGSFAKYVISYNELRISLADFLPVLEKNSLRPPLSDHARDLDIAYSAMNPSEWNNFQGECSNILQSSPHDLPHHLICSFWRQEVKDLLGKKDGKTSQSTSKNKKGLAVLPLEILETRESSATFAQFDVGLLDGTWEDLRSQLARLTDQHTLRSAVMNRRSFLDLSMLDLEIQMDLFDDGHEFGADELGGIALGGSEKQATGSASYHESMLVRSSQITVSLGRGALTAARFQEFVKLLKTKIPEFNNRQSLGLVLPEILGDLIYKDDPSKARKAYSLALQTQRETKRLIYKILERCESILEDHERKYLVEKCLKTERRKKRIAWCVNEYARILLRELGGSITSDERQGILEWFELAVANYPLSPEFIMHYSNALIACDQIDKAMAWLSEIATASNLEQGEVSHAVKAQVNYRLGCLWVDQYKRLDLAKVRFLAAFASRVPVPGLLDSMESLARTNKDAGLLCEVLCEKFSEANREELQDLSSAEFNLLIEEIISMVEQSDVDMAKICTSLQIAASLKVFTLNNINRLGHCSIPRVHTLDWNLLIEHQKTLLGSWSEDEEQLGLFYYEWAQLAEDHREEILSNDLIVILYENALSHDLVNPAMRSYLTKVYLDNSQMDDLLELLLKALKLEQEDHRQEILMELLLHFPASSQRVEWLIALVALEPGNKESLFHEIANYAAQMNVDSLVNMIHVISESEMIPISLKVEVFWSVPLAIAEENRAKLSAALAYSFEKLFQFDEDVDRVCHEAVAHLKLGGRHEAMAPYVTTLLQRNQLPLIDSQLAKNIVGDHSDLMARFYELFSQHQIASEKVASLREAALIYAHNSNNQRKVLEILREIGTTVSLNEDEWQIAVNCFKETDYFTGIFDLIQNQIPHLLNRADREHRLVKFVLFLRDCVIVDPNRAELVIQWMTSVILPTSVRPYQLIKILAEIYALADRREDEVELLLNMIGQMHDAFHATFVEPKQFDDDLTNLTWAIERLRNLAISTDRLDAILLQFFEDAAVVPGLQIRIATLASQVGVNRREYFTVLWQNEVESKNFAKAGDYWQQGAKCLMSRREAKAYLDQTKTVLASLDKDSSLPTFINQIRMSDVKKHVGPKIFHEILVRLGLALFEREYVYVDTYRILKKAYEIDPRDNRIWIPIYFLITEVGAEVERLAYLEDLVPKLRDDASVLRSYPLTFESIEIELNHLRKTADPINRNGVQQNKWSDLFDKSQPPSSSSSSLEKADEEADLEVTEAISQQSSAEETSVEVPLLEVPSLNEPIKLPVEAQIPAKVEESEEVAEKENYLLANDYELPMVSGEAATPFIGYASQNQSGDLVEKGQDDSAKRFRIADDERSDDDAAAIESRQKSSSDLSSPELSSNHLFSADEVSAIIDMNQLEQKTPEFPVLKEGLQKNEVLESVGDNNDQIVADKDDNKEIGGEPLEKLSWPSDSSNESAKKDHQASELNPQVGEEPLVPPPPAEAPAHLAQVVDETVSRRYETYDGSYNAEADASDLSNGSNFSTGKSQRGDDSSFHSKQYAIQEEMIDWRQAILKSEFNAELTNKLLAKAFASELEKHVAIQTVALVAGNCDRLSGWHWRVWRHSEERGYLLTAKERFPGGEIPSQIFSTLHKYLLALAPIFVRAQKDRFSMQYLVMRLGISMESIEKLRKPLAWHHDLLAEVGFKGYARRFGEKKFKAYGLSGLDREIFYDGRSRSIYFDDTYYITAPPSHLFHRILGVLWSVRLQYFVLLALDPRVHILPVVEEVHKFLSAQGISKFVKYIHSRNEVERYLTHHDIEKIRTLHEKVGMPTEAAIVQMWEQMRLFLFKVLVAETLDIVGLFESILDKDLLMENDLDHSEIYKRTPYAKALIDFICSLRI